MKTKLIILATATLCLAAMPSCKKKDSSATSNKIVIWHWLTDREAALTDLAAKYKAATGVDVQFQLYAPSDNYQQKVRVGAQTNSLPDIFGVLGESRDLADFVKAGHVEKLDE